MIPAPAPRPSRLPARRGNGRTSGEEDNGGEGRGAHALWSGAISFGLVRIPVRLVAAASGHSLSFHQVDRRDLARIRYERVNEHSGEKVAWDDIVKAYELPDGRLVIVDESDLAKAGAESARVIDIQDFVRRDEIPPAYFDRPYFVLPERGAAKAYRVLHDALVRKGYVAVALVVIRTRQHLAALMPQGEGLVLDLLRFPEDLKSFASLERELPVKSKVSDREAALAEQLVESLAGKWDPARYRDTYRDELLAAIERKADTGMLPPAATPARIPRHQVVDLVSLLQKSVQRSHRGGGHRTA